MSYRSVPPSTCRKVNKFPVLFCLLRQSKFLVSAVIMKAGSGELVAGTRLTRGSLTFHVYADLLDLVFSLPP